MKNEKVVQDAIHNALTARYAQIKKPFTIHGPSNRSQGFGIKQYCVDLIGVLDNAQVILLEVKYKEATGKLRSFDPEQHNQLIAYEEIGVPVAYAYNSVPPNGITYYKRPQPKNWPILTLKEIHRSTPKPLPNETPAQNHKTLWDWLSSSKDTKAIEMFGKVMGAWNSAPNLRNGKMVLIYAAQAGVMSLLDSKEMKLVSKFLQSGTIDSIMQQKVLQILRASNDTKDQLSKLHSSPTKRSSTPGGSNTKP